MRMRKKPNLVPRMERCAAEKVETASILSDIYGSDHCPVELEIAW